MKKAGIALLILGALAVGIVTYIHKRPVVSVTSVAESIANENQLSHTAKKRRLLSQKEPLSDLIDYRGPIAHVFFHSLIIYPDLAFRTPRAEMYRKNMITVAQFKDILSRLYSANYVLIDGDSLYSLDAKGHILPNTLELPKGKKPLILSLDDLNYYSFMKDSGFANKLVLDNNKIRTEVTTPDGRTEITDDGDVIPIVDAFVQAHADFSFEGAKGIIGETGFEGILGYRTQLTGPAGDKERRGVAPVVDALKANGWKFASHSYSHGLGYLNGTISTTSLSEDLRQWSEEVGPIVGPTDIFIGPFGQVFKPGDPRRTQLVQSGFRVLFGVGMDGYLKYFDTYLMMDRMDIDGYRISHDPKRLHRLLDI